MAGTGAYGSPEALLTLYAVRELEAMPDIGPGGVHGLLLRINYAQSAHSVELLRMHGYIADSAHDDLSAATPGASASRPDSNHLWLPDEDGDWYHSGRCWCYRRPADSARSSESS